MKKQVNLKLAALALLMVALTMQVSGQRPGGGPGGGRGFQMTEEDIKERVDNLQESLQLTQDQHKKLMYYELESYNKMQIERQKMMNNQGGQFDREAMRATMMKSREEREKKYEEVLTREQMKKFTEIQEQRRNQMRQQYQQNNPEGDGDGDRPARGRGRN